MGALKLIERSATVGFCPTAPLLAAGTVAGAIDMSFSTNSVLEVRLVERVGHVVLWIAHLWLKRMGRSVRTDVISPCQPARRSTSLTSRAQLRHPCLWQAQLQFRSVSTASPGVRAQEMPAHYRCVP